MYVVYYIIRPFGSAAQAGFGVGGRITQSLFLPVLALSFAVAPVVGQNFGGRQATRVRETFRSAISMSVALMLLLTLLAQLAGSAMIGLFTKDPNVIAFGREYLNIISFNFVAVGIIFTSSSVFQGIGNTLPPLVSSSTRLVLFALPAILLSRMPGFQIVHVWYLSVASVFLQAMVNLLLLQREMRMKLSFSSPLPAATASAGVASVS
jgi:Na+-driven multidrug efflux pump